MKFSTSFLFGCAALSAAQATQTITSIPSGAPVVDLGYAKYVGYVNDTSKITYYRGIQYAQPPVGELRWRKPRPIVTGNSFQGATLNASTYAPSCYQSAPYYVLLKFPGSGTPIPSSENCLVLDVLVPNHPQSDRLPVVVQIHGGGYTQGNTESYPGDRLTWASNGSVIYVAIQLGIFGFLGGSQIADNGVLNAGLLDQRAALEWVQRNIGAFGGDPARVTIWGGSAGGGSVTYQLTAGNAYDVPPFSAAIAEYPWWQPLLIQLQQDTQLFTALRLSNCTSVSCLRGLAAADLRTLGQQVQNVSYPEAQGYGSYYFGPVVDGESVRDLPSQAFKKGNFYDIPIMLDRDAYEGFSFSNASETTQMEQAIDAQQIFPYAGPAFFSRLYQLYPREAFNSTFYQRVQWFGDFIINCPTALNCPTDLIASRAVDWVSNSSAVFKLTFAAGTETHAATGAFLASRDIAWSAGNNNATFAEIMTSYWTSFITTHDPNPGRVEGAPFWPSYASGGNGTLGDGEVVGFETLGVRYSEIVVEGDPDVSDTCDFFSSNEYVVRN
ncbi:hypothetical protein LTR95_014381 [Oleoguttula sp. CCFEE 5521]